MGAGRPAQVPRKRHLRRRRVLDFAAMPARPPPTLPGARTLRQLAGQERAVSQLERAIASGKLAQAYVFDGPDGVGKRAAAIALGAALNCRQVSGHADLPVAATSVAPGRRPTDNLPRCAG